MPASDDFAYQGPKRGADRAVLLAHGAGADMHAATLTTVADALADAKIPSLRFNFPYRAAGRRAPDRAPVLEAALRDAAAELARRAKLPPERLVLGGRSMGGRIASMVIAGDGSGDTGGTGGATEPALGLVLLGYPLHPPGRADKLRVEHFVRLRVPVLFVSGTRDAFGTPAELKRQSKKLQGPVAFHWVESGDHGFKPLKSSGLTVDGVLHDVAATVVDFIAHLDNER